MNNIDQSVFSNNNDKIVKTMQASHIDIPIDCPSVNGTLSHAISVARTARLMQKNRTQNYLCYGALKSYDILRVVNDVVGLIYTKQYVPSAYRQHVVCNKVIPSLLITAAVTLTNRKPIIYCLLS